jgi:hypothetical protein
MEVGGFALDGFRAGGAGLRTQCQEIIQGLQDTRLAAVLELVPP